jgi:hypothetical protein
LISSRPIAIVKADFRREIFRLHLLLKQNVERLRAQRQRGSNRKAECQESEEFGDEANLPAHNKTLHGTK